MVHSHSNARFSIKSLYSRFILFLGLKGVSRKSALVVFGFDLLFLFLFIFAFGVILVSLFLEPLLFIYDDLDVSDPTQSLPPSVIAQIAYMQTIGLYFLIGAIVIRVLFDFAKVRLLIRQPLKVFLLKQFFFWLVFILTLGSFVSVIFQFYLFSLGSLFVTEKIFLWFFLSTLSGVCLLAAKFRTTLVFGREISILPLWISAILISAVCVLFLESFGVVFISLILLYVIQSVAFLLFLYGANHLKRKKSESVV